MSHSGPMVLANDTEVAPPVTLTDVTVRKRHRDLISGISVFLRPGVTALLGRNGAGKTTLIRLIAGVQRPSSGSVQIDGDDIHASRDAMDKHRARLGWVPQGAGYPPKMGVGQFVEYAAWLGRVDRHHRHDAVRTALESCGISSLSDRVLGTLSGGERQRVVLASAIVTQPTLVLLDEPTVGLDPAQRESYLQLVLDLGQQVTVLYSTHIVEDVVRTASRVLVMDRGQFTHDLHGSDLVGSADQLGVALRQAVIESGDRNA